MKGTIDPLSFADLLWPDVRFYKQQQDIIYSTCENDETFVPAGNKLGKDFVGGFIVLYFFLTRHPCRIVTTSAKSEHLSVLWGEIGRFIQRAKYPLDSRKGGPLTLNHHDIGKIVNKQKCPISYLKGMVASEDSIAAMQGHHVTPDDLETANDGIPRTLFVVDEASSVPDAYHKMTRSWASRTLVLGNTWPCDNFFKHAVKGNSTEKDKGGDILAPGGQRYYRKIIKIRAADSPNVRFGFEQLRLGQKPTNEIIVPGVKSYAEYCKDRAICDKVQQAVTLDAEWEEGAGEKLYPREWLNNAARIAESLNGKPRHAVAIGIDPAEGGDSTVMCAVDNLGLIGMVSKKTPDTAVIVDEAIAFMKTHGVAADRCVLDRGGGGKQIADQLRRRGYPVRTVAFGESLMLDPKRSMTRVEERVENREERYTYLNRRAQMYGELRGLLDPAGGGFGIPAECTELVRQLGPMPLLFDSEGRMRMLPKNRRDPKSKEKTLTELLGCSPDEADSLVLACHGMLHKSTRAKAGAI